MRMADIDCTTGVRALGNGFDGGAGAPPYSQRAFSGRSLVLLIVALFGLLFVPRVFADVTGARITASPTQINEGETTQFAVRLTSNNDAEDSATVTLGVSGSATLGVDYEIVGYAQGPITLGFDSFYPASTQTVIVRALNDNVFSEGPETIIFTISQCEWPNVDGIDEPCPTGSSATVTIVDTTPRPVATIEATDPNASAEGPDPGELTIRLSQPAPSSGIAVNFTVGGTAAAGVDYQALRGSAIVPAGGTSVAIPVALLTSTSADDKTVVATLQPGSDYEVGQPSSATVSIAGARPTATIEATDPEASKEGSDPGELTIRLNTPAPSSGVRVDYSTGGSAAPNQDYRALSGFVFVPQGQTSASIAVGPLLGTSGGAKTVVATLLPGSSYVLGQPSSATVTIADAVLALVPASGNGQVGSTGQPLQPFVVTATTGGSPAVGIPILWTITSGEGALSSARTLTDAQGRASTVLTPSSNGDFVVKAQAEGTDFSVAFSAVYNPLAGLPGLTGPQRSMATTLDILCPKLGVIAGQRALTAGEQDLLTQCKVLIGSSVSNPGAAAQGIAALTPEQAAAPRTVTNRIAGAQLDNIASRLTALRRGARGISLSGLTFQLDEQSIDSGAVAGLFRQAGETGGGASADDAYQFERLGVFVSGNIDGGDKDRTANEDGYDFNTIGVTAGADYRFAEGLVLGLALGYGSTSVDIDSNGGNLDANAWSSTLYGTYYATDHFYLEGSATYGWGDYDQTRNISYSLLGAPRVADATFKGNQYAFMVGGGYDFIRGAGIFDLYGRLQSVQVDLESYSERGASGLDLDIGSQESSSLASVLGVNYTHSISISKMVLLPQGWIEWFHEFDDGDENVNGFFTNDPSRIPFALATDAFDTDYFRLGLGLGAQFGQGRTAYLNYEAAMGMNSYREQSVNLGLRLDF